MLAIAPIVCAKGGAKLALTPPPAWETCPGSSAKRHSTCALEVSFDASCADVQREIEARIAGAGGWRCPKSHPGEYMLLNRVEARNRVPGRTMGSRATGAGAHPPNPNPNLGPFLDKFGFDFQPDGGKRCEVRACSESQGGSFCDYSTNYCNLRNLYCSQAEGCREVHIALRYTEKAQPCCLHAARCPGALASGYETNVTMCKR